MIFYPYRSLFAMGVSLSLFVGFYFYDFQPHWKKWKSNIEIKKALTIKLTQPSVSSLQPLLSASVLMHEADLLSDFLIQLHLNGLIVESVQNISSSNDKFEIRLNVKGDFKQFSSFILMQMQSIHPVIFKDFSWRQSSDSLLVFVFNVQFFKNVIAHPLISSVSSTIKNNKSPFCFNKNFSLLEEESNLEQSTSFTVMKMMGYIGEGKRAQALLSLPNHLTIVAKIGSLIEKEKSEVIQIKPDQVVVIVNNKKFIIQ